MPTLSQSLRKILWGDPWGKSFPERPAPQQGSVDGRTVALRILRQYLHEIVFRRPDKRNPDGSVKPPIEFQIPEKDIHIEWPDNEVDLVFPSMVFLSKGPANYDMIGLTTYVEEDTRDLYAPGTVVQWMSEYQEEVVVELWATTKPERRALLAGIEWALSPTEQMYGVRFTMPDYFNELVCFTFKNRELIDEDDAVRGRRRARVIVEMRFNIVALVNYNQGHLQLKVNTDVDQDSNIGVVVDQLEPNRRPGDNDRDKQGCC